MTAGSDSPWGWYAPGEFVHEIDMLAQAGSRTGTRSSPGRPALRSRSASAQWPGGSHPAARPTSSWYVATPPGDRRSLGVLDVWQAGRRVQRGVA